MLIVQAIKAHEAKFSTEFLTILLLMFLKVLTDFINNYLWLI